LNLPSPVWTALSRDFAWVNSRQNTLDGIGLSDLRKQSDEEQSGVSIGEFKI
jgi:hypothetical protein